MSRHKLKDLAKQLKIGEKQPRIARSKQEEPKATLRAVSKLQPQLAQAAPSKQSHLSFDREDEDVSQVLDLTHSSEHGDIGIDSTQTVFEESSATNESGPRLTEEGLRDFMKPDKKGRKEDDLHSVKASRPSRRQTSSDQYDDDFEDDNESLFSEQSVQEERRNVPRPTSATGRTRRAPEDNGVSERSGGGSESVPKLSIVKLIKSSNLQSAGAELVDAVRELILQFTRTVLEKCADNRLINAANLHRYMSTYIENEEKDLNNDIVIATAHFERLIRPICEEHGYVIKRDTFYLLHLFVETVMVKILQASDMVADAANRKRVCAKDVLVAFSIYMM